MQPEDFKELMETCGISNKGAAYLFKVRVDTVLNWKNGRCNIPEGVQKDITEYAKQAKRIFEHEFNNDEMQEEVERSNAGNADFDGNWDDSWKLHSGLVEA